MDYYCPDTQFFCREPTFPYIVARATKGKIFISFFVIYSVATMIFYAFYQNGWMPPRVNTNFYEAFFSYSYISGTISVLVLLYHRDSPIERFLQCTVLVLFPLFFAMIIIIVFIMPSQTPQLIIGAILGHLIHIIALIFIVQLNKRYHITELIAGGAFWCIYTILLYLWIPKYPMLWYSKSMASTLILLGGSIAIMITITIIQRKRSSPQTILSLDTDLLNV